MTLQLSRRAYNVHGPKVGRRERYVIFAGKTRHCAKASSILYKLLNKKIETILLLYFPTVKMTELVFIDHKIMLICDYAHKRSETEALLVR